MKRAAEREIQLRLREVWTRTRPIVEERISVLASVVNALRSGPLGDGQRASGIGAAHKLAGSLGMFGLNDASEFARNIENALSLQTPAHEELTRLLTQLRAAVQAHKNAMEA